jgi:hypothetical protein
VSSRAQIAADSIPLNIDSLEKELDAFLALYKKGSNQSYFQVSAGFSNTQYSVSNLALNAQQLQQGVALTPALTYVHKSGLSLGYNHFYLLSGAKPGITQHSITPGFDYSKGKAFDFGIYYTRFFTNKRLQEYASPYKNDWYAYAEYNRWKVQPSVAFGYSTGGFTQTSRTDSSITIDRPFRPDTTIRFSIFDTLQAQLRDFTVTANFRHQFLFKGKASTNYYTFTPALLFFFARNKYEVEYTSVSAISPRTRLFLQNKPQLRDALIRELQNSFPGVNQTRNFLNTTNFSLQSIGLNLEGAVYLNKFYINPQIYFDYYLQGSADPLNMFFTLSTGFFF